MKKETEEKRYQEYLRKKKEKELNENKESLIEKLAKERKERLNLIKEKEKKKTVKPKVEIKKEIEKVEVKKEKPRTKKIIIEKDDSNKRTGRDLLKEKILDLEKQISNTKYNKRTQHAIGLMKAQLATLKAKLSAGKGKGGSSDHGYNVRKTGDATVVLLGFPSTGKSTLLNKITGAESETGAYAFTTLTVIPGMLDYKFAKIQILDVPGIVEGASAGTGRGKEVLQVIRTADLILMMIDSQNLSQKEKILKEVYDSFVRINQKKPDIKITRTIKDGIRVGRTVETPDLDDETVEGILRQFKIINAEVLIRENISPDQLIDVIEQNKVYIPAITAVSKIDLVPEKDRTKMKEKMNADILISAVENKGVDELKDLIFDKLEFIRIFLKEVNQKADLEEPMVMRKGDTLKSLCEKLHKDFVDKFRYARIWGNSVKFDGQKILKINHKLKDNDIIEIHID